MLFRIDDLQISSSGLYPLEIFMKFSLLIFLIACAFGIVVKSTLVALYLI